MGKKSEKNKREKTEKKLKKVEKEQQKKERKAATKQGKVTPEERAEMIATAAYFIAERHGFTPGRTEADWQTAEQEIDQLLKAKKKGKKEKG